MLSRLVLFCWLLTLRTVAVPSGSDEEYDEDLEKELLDLLEDAEKPYIPEEEVETLRRASLMRERKHLFQCRKENQSCGGLIPCCDNFKCYWAQGYSLVKGGRCISCVEAGHKCQHSGQCCGDLICQKGGALYIDGSCGGKKDKGETCHDSQQCKSNKCILTTWQKLVFAEGSCA